MTKPRAAQATLVLLLVAVPAMRGYQERSAERRFATATVRSATAPLLPIVRSNMGMSGSRFVASSVSLQTLLAFAYQVRDVRGADDWMSDRLWDVDAMSAAPLSSPDVPAAVRSLLVDRFGLSVRRESRNGPVYLMALARQDGKPGPRLWSTDGDCSQPRAGGAPFGLAGLAGSPGACGRMVVTGGVTGGGIELSQLAVILGEFVDRPIVDRTGATGRFDFSVAFAPLMAAGGEAQAGAKPAAVTPDMASVVRALRDQLGLELTPGTARIETLVVERASPPADPSK